MCGGKLSSRANRAFEVERCVLAGGVELSVLWKVTLVGLEQGSPGASIVTGSLQWQVVHCTLRA